MDGRGLFYRVRREGRDMLRKGGGEGQVLTDAGGGEGAVDFIGGDEVCGCGLDVLDCFGGKSLDFHGCVVCLLGMGFVVDAPMFGVTRLSEDCILI